MSLSRHFQFVLSQNEAAACRRFLNPNPVKYSPLWKNDQAHLRNVMLRLAQHYRGAKSQTPTASPHHHPHS